MNPHAAQIIAQGFLKGVCDVFEAMLSSSFQYTIEEPQLLSSRLMEALLKDHPVVLYGNIEKNQGAVALLFSGADAVRISAMIQSTEPQGRAILDDSDRSMLLEMADPVLGGGVANLMERFKKGVQQLETPGMADTGTAMTDMLMQLLGADPTAVAFRFNAPPGFTDKGILVFSQRIENMVPAEVSPTPIPEPVSPAPQGAELSPEEMHDIMSGFGPPKAGGNIVGGGSDLSREVRANSENLDVIMDIRLEATARLGRVEMPIGAILTLGPGSIVEVGHLVDEPVDLFINDKLVARGDVVVVDEKFGLRITEIVSTRERIQSLR